MTAFLASTCRGARQSIYDLAVQAEPGHRVQVLGLLSGGVDSSTLLAAAKSRGTPCTALHVSYGQPAEREETAAAQAIASSLGIELECVQMQGVAFETGEIVGRNSFLVATALLWLGRRQATIGLAIHDGTEYADCTPAFADLIQKSLEFHTQGATRLWTPFLGWTKAEIWKLATDLRAPLQFAYSCEDRSGPCGICASCRDREALSSADSF